MSLVCVIAFLFLFFCTAYVCFWIVFFFFHLLSHLFRLIQHIIEDKMTQTRGPGGLLIVFSAQSLSFFYFKYCEDHQGHYEVFLKPSKRQFTHRDIEVFQT